MTVPLGPLAFRPVSLAYLPLDISISSHWLELIVMSVPLHTLARYDVAVRIWQAELVLTSRVT